MSHTKGPWTVFNTPSGYKLIEHHPNGGGPETREPVCKITSDEKNELANAALISAAPELYEALKLLVYGPISISSDFDEARTAMAKARYALQKVEDQ